jgi:hypothetical protein
MFKQVTVIEDKATISDFNRLQDAKQRTIERDTTLCMTW